MTGPSENGLVPGLELELPPKPEFVRTARHAVAAVGRLHELPDELVEELKLAVSEACTNAVASAEVDGAVSDGPVRLTTSVEGDRVVIELVDPRGSVPREVSGDPSEIDTADLPFERALALPLIRGLVDELTMAPAEGGGLRMQMVVGVERSDG
jgi:serine/threonine-protein kinase RsbW